MLTALATAACVALTCPAPIGAGPEFHPPARWPLAGGAAFHRFGAIHGGPRVHLELFAGGRVIVVPGGIGVAAPRTTLHGFIVAAPGRADAWTLFSGGVFTLAREGLTLGELFDVWGQPLDARTLLGFSGPVRVYAGGRRVSGDPRALALHDGDQVVLEVGPYVPPHALFTFHSDRL
ncbi:MAG TPA: hypothetical protein VNS09_25565 [Solirubrobacter sp.]|nr:hypothetical protein [Solirubrobacter sp.]